MTHLFKVNLQFSDMFIRKLDFSDNTIVYQIFDSFGKPMESIKTDKFTLKDNRLFFDLNRNIDLKLAQFISQILI